MVQMTISRTSMNANKLLMSVQVHLTYMQRYHLLNPTKKTPSLVADKDWISEKPGLQGIFHLMHKKSGLQCAQMMKGSDIEFKEKTAKLLMNGKLISSLPKHLTRMESVMSIIVHQTKDLHTADYTQLYDFLKYNQKEVDDQRAERLVKTHDPLALMANSNNPFNYPLFHQDQPSLNSCGGLEANGGNQFRQYAGQNVGYQNEYNAVQNVGNQVVQDAVQNQGVQNIGNQNGQIGAQNIGNGNVVAARAEGNATGNNGNQIRCYNCRGLGHLARNCTVRPRRRDAAYLQTQLLIAQKEEAGIQLQAEEFDLMAAAADLDEIEEVNANCILMANLQQASTSGTQTDKAPVYDSDGSAEVHNYDNCYDNEIFNMFTQEEQYTEILEPIPEPHQVQQNDNVISDISGVEQEGGTVDQHTATVEETRAYFESLYNNLALKFGKSSGKQITTLNEEISNLSKQLSTEKSTVSSLLEEKKKLKSDFKIREDELLDKQIQLENKIKELDNILVKTGQSMHMLSPKPDSFYHTEQKMALGYQNPFYLKQAQRKHQCLYDGKVLLEKHDPPVVHDSEETMQLAQESRQKMKQLNKEIKPANYTKINHLSGVFVSQTAKSQEEVYLVNTSKMATVSKSISIPNEEFLDDTTLNSPNLQTELDRTKERLENCIIKKENEYAKLWNDWYKKCEECKYDKISYDKAYNDMQQKIERLQAQLGDLKGKSQDTPCVSNTLDPLSQKLENENVELEFQVRNYEKEIAHLKTTYKNLFDSIKVTRTQTKAIIDSLQDKLHDTIYENAKLRAQLFDKVSDQKDTNKGTSANTKFAKQSILGKPPSSSRFPKVGETNALSKPVTSNSVPSSRESTVVNNERVIAPGIFRINPFKASRGPKKDLLRLKGKIITSSESESQSDCSKGCQNWFDTLLIPLLSEYNLKDKEDHGDNECDT
ncbi:retrovirus-related pol polyprotein from transposon TNT 1-94 [Tanacetum coccineum]